MRIGVQIGGGILHAIAVSMTYTQEPAQPTDRCYVCGGPAHLEILADSAEAETGYLDSRAYCDDCYAEALADLAEECRQ